MTFIGRIQAPKQGEKFWEIKIPDLGIFTQGTTEHDAFVMVVNAIETLVDQKHFKIKIRPLGKGRFLVSANDPTLLIARWLYRLRVDSGLSIREAAQRLGAKSPEAWARYESGRASPTVEKLSELLRAISPESTFTLKRVV